MTDAGPLRRLRRAAATIERVRKALDSPHLPPHLIERPTGMRVRDFNRRIKILIQAEQVAARSISEYLGIPLLPETHLTRGHIRPPPKG